MDKITVLICDSDRAVHHSLSAALAEENIDAVSVYDHDSMREHLSGGGIDLIVMEAVMPQIDGMEILWRIRQHGDMPVIVLSAKADESDRVMGLKLGADDYIAKPFSPREVVARIQGILRRSGRMKHEKRIDVGELTIYPDSFTALLRGRRMVLIPSDFKLLSYLAVNAGKVLSRDQILNAVWGYEYYGSTRAVDTQIKRIRRSMEQENADVGIHSIYGVGYKLEKLSAPADKN